MKIYNDRLLSADNGDVSELCLLDLTAAFDTVDRDLMILKLERQFGLRGVVLDWFRSYLCSRTYRIIHGNKTSPTVHVCVRASRLCSRTRRPLSTDLKAASMMSVIGCPLTD